MVQYNLVDNQYQPKSEVLYTFTLTKSYAYLLNFEASNLVFLKTYNSEFNKITITFTDQNGRPLEIEDKVKLTLFMRRYSIEPRTRKYVKGLGFLSFGRKYKKQLLDTGLDSLKSASKKLVHKAGKFLENKIADAEPNDDKVMKPDENRRNTEEIIIPLEKRDETLNKLRKVLEK